MAEQLDNKLINSEVYRFAISGAPLSQYLHILRHEVLKYSPDLVVINLVHNDFEQSYLKHIGIYTSSFLKLKIADGKVVGEYNPVKYEKRWFKY